MKFYTLDLLCVLRENKVVIMALLKYLKPLHVDGSNSVDNDLIAFLPVISHRITPRRLRNNEQIVDIFRGT